MRNVGTRFSPLDLELQILPNQRLTPRMEMLAIDFGGEVSFGRAAQKMRLHHGVTLSKECVRQRTQRAGAAYVAVQAEATPETPLSQEPVGERMMLSVDAAKIHTTTGEWRDAKTLTIAEVDEDGETHSNSYFTRVAEHTEFARQAQVETCRRQIAKSTAVCAVNDGAEWIPPVIDALRPDAERILDFYHGAEHLAEDGRAALGEGTPAFQAWFDDARHDLRHGTPDDTLVRLADLGAEHPEAIETINRDQAYFTKRLDMIRYVEFKAANWPIGSGPGEAAHKIVVQVRMKGAGMRWHADNVNSMLAIRNLLCNNRWESDWRRIVAYRLGLPQNPPQPPRPTPKLLPQGFELRRPPAWTNQPVGMARLRPFPAAPADREKS